MKKQYAVLVRIITVEMIILFILAGLGVRIKSEIGNMIAVFLVFLPIELLLFRASKDQNLKSVRRIICKFYFWFIIVVYVGTATIKLCLLL